MSNLHILLFLLIFSTTEYVYSTTCIEGPCLYLHPVVPSYTDSTLSHRNFTFGTRGSNLAVKQTDEVISRISNANPELSDKLKTLIYKTTGDIRLDVPLAKIGGKGLFTKELESALLNNKIDACVHSTKDVPTWISEGTTLGCYLPREDPGDAFISHIFSNYKKMNKESIVGSSSPRRQAQLLLLNPSLRIVNFRGNVETRLRKLRDGKVDATILAVSGLNRLGLNDHVTQMFDYSDMLPAVGQGAICIQCREDDVELIKILRSINCEKTEKACNSERAFLEELEGNCHSPIAAHVYIKDKKLYFRGLIADPVGKSFYTIDMEGDENDYFQIGREAGQRIKFKAGENFINYITSSDHSNDFPTI